MLCEIVMLCNSVLSVWNSLRRLLLERYNVASLTIFNT